MRTKKTQAMINQLASRKFTLRFPYTNPSFKLQIEKPKSSKVTLKKR